MVLKGVDEIDWFTDRPDRVAGEWSPKKLVKKWDSLFGDIEPNAQATFEIASKRNLVAFEMSKPRLSDSNQKLSFKVRGVGEKNKALITKDVSSRLANMSLFVDGTYPAESQTNGKLQISVFSEDGGTLFTQILNSAWEYTGDPVETVGDASPTNLYSYLTEFNAPAGGEMSSFQIPIRAIGSSDIQTSFYGNTTGASASLTYELIDQYGEELCSKQSVSMTPQVNPVFPAENSDVVNTVTLCQSLS